MLSLKTNSIKYQFGGSNVVSISIFPTLFDYTLSIENVTKENKKMCCCIIDSFYCSTVSKLVFLTVPSSSLKQVFLTPTYLQKQDLNNEHLNN